MAGAGKPQYRLLRVARRTLYWGLPPLILYVVLTRIDVDELGRLATIASLPLLAAGIFMIVPTIMLGALRWHFLVRRYDCALLPVAASIREYWKSLAVGVLAPGSLGSDAYRVMILGRPKANYLRNAFVIGVEKLGALVSCAALITVLYPKLGPNHLPAAVDRTVGVLYLMLVAGSALLILVLVVRRHSVLRRVASAFGRRIGALARRATSFASVPAPQEESIARNGVSLTLSMFRPKIALPVLALSLAIHFISAVQSQIFFQVFDYEISFFVNLFVTPLLFLLYAMPISFGGTGIREGAFILAYGAFSVPVETSLIISFSGLLANFVSYAIGASLFLFSNKDEQ